MGGGIAKQSAYGYGCTLGSGSPLMADYLPLTQRHMAADAIRRSLTEDLYFGDSGDAGQSFTPEAETGDTLQIV
ncbi:MAG: hypothetical protein R6U93_03370 [Dehalococcoidia bacterium]